MALSGIDVSHHNGVIDFDALTLDLNSDFVIAKATQGTRFIDSQFERNMERCREKNILRGAYHFVTADDPWLQADHFCDVVGKQDNGVLLALDIEDDSLKNFMPDRVADMVEMMAAQIYFRLNTLPLIYVSRSFMHPKMFANIGDKCGGWIAAWGDRKPFRQDLNTSIWQHSNRGQVEGIVGNVDLDIAYMTHEAWYKIANPLGVR